MTPEPSANRGLRLALGLGLLGALAAGPAGAVEALSADDTAACIAAMQTQADDWARQVREGDKASEPALLTELERAAALMGRSYLDGAHDEAKAKARLKAAQDLQATWTDEQRLRLRLTCDGHADAELAATSRPQRFIVERLARSRLKRMLKPPG